MNTHQLNNTANTYPNNGRPLLPSSNYPKPMVVTPHPPDPQKRTHLNDRNQYQRRLIPPKKPLALQKKRGFPPQQLYWVVWGYLQQALLLRI